MCIKTMTNKMNLKDYIVIALLVISNVGSLSTLYNNGIYLTKIEAREMKNEYDVGFKENKADHTALISSVNSLDKKVDILTERQTSSIKAFNDHTSSVKN